MVEYDLLTLHSFENKIVTASSERNLDEMKLINGVGGCNTLNTK